MSIPTPETIDERHVALEGKKLLYFGGCDYLRLSHKAEIRLSAVESLRNEPSLSSSASRTTTGDRSIYLQLEKQLTALNRTEDTLLTGAGYLANLSLSSYLSEAADGLLIDEQCHPSLRDAAKLSGLPVRNYRHCDVKSAAEISSELPDNQHWFLLSESMFGLDGSIMPLNAFRRMLPVAVSFIIDDAHGFGVLGHNFWNEGDTSFGDARTVIKTLSLAKTVGCHGGAIAGPLKVTNSIRNQGATWAGHTPFPMHLAHAAIKSIEWLSTKPELGSQLSHRIDLMSNILSSLGLLKKAGLMSPVFSFRLRETLTEESIQTLKDLVMDSGIYPSFIRYPGGLSNLIFRVAISSSHQKGDLQKLGKTLMQLRQSFGCEQFLLSDQMS